MKPVCTIMRGLPGCGKSTVAISLAAHHRTVYCSADSFFTKPDGAYNYDTNRVRDAHEACQRLARSAMGLGLNVVIDNCNTNAKTWRVYAEMAAEHGYDIQFIEPQTAWKFDVDELFARNVHNVPRESIEKMKARWRPVLSASWNDAAKECGYLARWQELDGGGPFLVVAEEDEDDEFKVINKCGQVVGIHKGWLDIKEKS
jgi:predicted kinase